MRRYVLAAVLAASPAMSFAETREAISGSDSIRITLDVCTAQPVLALIPEQYRNVVRDAVSVVNGQSWHACWFMDGANVHLLYEDGDQGLIPFAAFKRVKEA